ncbi:zinc finger, CCHC-type containing protein [Tanacetum coccineum]
MYLTSSRPDIMFTVYAYARYQVNPKVSHLHAMKRIFRYLKGQPKLGLWYPKDSPFDLVAYTDSDYAGASLDRKSTTEGCQLFGCRLISWQCKKQTVVANSTTKAEYVAASSCYLAARECLVWVAAATGDVGLAVGQPGITEGRDVGFGAAGTLGNTIELPEGNNVVPLRFDTIWLVQNECSFHGLRSEDPNQHLKDFLKLVDSLDLDGSISTWEDLTTRFLAQFFPPGRTAKLRNDILMFQQHHGESLSEAWTRFKDLLQKVPHHGIDLWLQVQFFYDHVNPVTRRTIDQSAGGKLREVIPTQGIA